MNNNARARQQARANHLGMTTPRYQPDVVPGDEHRAGQSTFALLDRSRKQYPGRLSPEQRDLRDQARSEERTGKVLDRLARVGVRALHDRRLPHSASQLDHVVIAWSGVYLINAVAVTRRHPQQWISGRLCVGGQPLVGLAQFDLSAADEVARTIAQDFDPGWTIVVYPLRVIVGAPLALHVEEGVEVVDLPHLAARIMYRPALLDSIEVALLGDAAARACPPAA